LTQGKEENCAVGERNECPIRSEGNRSRGGSDIGREMKARRHIRFARGWIQADKLSGNIGDDNHVTEELRLADNSAFLTLVLPRRLVLAQIQ